MRRWRTHNAEAYLDAYLAAAGNQGREKSPLFRSLDKRRMLGESNYARWRYWVWTTRS
jgi:hypothetical protein